MRKLESIYRKDARGRLRVWYAVIEGDRYQTFDGIFGGALKSSEWTVCKSRNVGKANETTPLEQCSLEVSALYAKKLARQYHYSMECNDADKPLFPMLAKVLPKDFDPGDYEGGVWTQPKLDGVRCIAKSDGLWSREGKPLNIPHIWDAVAPYVTKFPFPILDGELYIHALKDDLGEIVSKVRHGDLALQYWVYDTPAFLPFPQRILEVAKDIDHINQHRPYDHPPVVKMVHASKALTLADLKAHHEINLSLGYEGTMVRLGEYPYEKGKRSASLLKLKEFQDAEFEVVSIEEGKGNYAGVAKRAVLKLPDGRTFGAGIRGTKQKLSVLLKGPTPKVATVRYFSLTPDGIPRFPVAVAFFAEGRDV